MIKKKFWMIIFFMVEGLYASKDDDKSAHSLDGAASPISITRNFSDDIGKRIDQQKSLTLIPYFMMQNKYGLSSNNLLLTENIIDDELDILPSQEKNEKNLTVKKNIKKIDLKLNALHEVLPVKIDEQDDLEYFDAQEGQLNVVLMPQDITAQDEYSGYDRYFDQLYQFAKRDLYLAQH